MVVGLHITIINYYSKNTERGILQIIVDSKHHRAILLERRNTEKETSIFTLISVCRQYQTFGESVEQLKLSHIASSSV